MRKFLSAVLFLVISISVHAQKKLKPADLTGTWQVTSMIADGTTIPLESNDAIRDFMLKQQAKKQAEDSTAMTGADSAVVEAAVKMMSEFSNSTIVFKADRTYQFVLVIGTIKNIENGRWAMNEATQVIRLTQVKKGKTIKSDVVKIIPKGSQLLVQMDQNSEEGFMVSKKK